MTNATPDQRLQLIGDYKHGSIRRVKLRNFLTYFDAEVKPGPRLNMVVGPNGTGKSTILCAICLGLGGEPRLLGRASEIETFVANGEDEGEIEIELQDTRGGTNPVIRRQIRRNDPKKRSVFFWDDKQITGRAVKEACLKNYDITVDNLCTFLPQDRVGSFSGFDSKQLLIETEKALSASQDLYHTHQELIQDQEEMRGGDNQRETLQDKLHQLQQESKRLERAKDLMDERDLAVAQADLLEKKMFWLDYDEKRILAIQKKEAKEELKAQKVECWKKIQPLENELQEVETQAAKLNEVWTKSDAEIRACKSEMDKQTKKYQTHDDAIENIIQDLQSIDANRAAKERKAHDLHEKVKQLKETLKDRPSLDTLTEEFQQCQKDIEATKPEYDNARRALARLAQEKQEIEDEHKEVATKAAKLQNEKERRKERIFRQQPDLGKISDWLSQNRDKFRKSVVGPVVCEITTKDVTIAAYLEQHVPNSTLKSFVVRCKEDYDLLYRCIREEQGIPINITTVRETKEVKRVYSEKKMEVLKQQHGVLGYMDECIAAPDVVLEALKRSAQIEKVLIGTDKTQDSLDTKGLLDFLAQAEDGSTKLQSSCIFSSQGDKSFKYLSKISKYSLKPSVQIDTIRPARFLAPGVSEEHKRKVAAELEKLEIRLDEIRPAFEHAKQVEHEANVRAQEVKAKLTTAKGNMEHVRKMENKIRSAEARAREAENELEVNEDDQKETLVSKLNKRILNSLMALEAQSVSYEKMMNATVKASAARLNLEPAKVKEQRASIALKEAREEFSAIDTQYKGVAAAYKDALQNCKRAQEKAKAEAPIQDDNGNDTPLKAQLDELAVETLSEALLALEDAMKKIDSIVADNNAIREFERNKAVLENVQAQLDDLVSFEERRRHELEAKVTPWETKLSQAVAKVDAFFGLYMGEMGCTGEVALTKGETTEEMPHGNFKDWGIEIRVSFREGHKLQVLSARVQSGGERSVSTIMYLMALQGMMVSPFRCVDEINQGLDERNERLVFKRIVANSTQPPGKDGPTDHTGQYFLITPKLLPNLYDMEVEAMTVLFIFNGPYNVKNPGDFDISKLLALRKRAIAATEAAEDEENTPNSQESVERPAKQTRRSLSTRNVDSIKEER